MNQLPSSGAWMEQPQGKGLMQRWELAVDQGGRRASGGPAPHPGKQRPWINVAWPWENEPPLHPQPFLRRGRTREIQFCSSTSQVHAFDLSTGDGAYEFSDPLLFGRKSCWYIYNFLKHCLSLQMVWAAGMMGLCFSLCEQKAKLPIACPVTKRARR